jgi:hypothetical protein
MSFVMGRADPASYQDRGAAYRAALEKTFPMQDDEFEEIAKIVPKSVTHNERAIRKARLRKGIELCWRLYEWERTGTCNDGPYLETLRRASKLAVKVHRALAREQDWNRRQAVLKNLDKMQKYLRELRAWITPMGQIIQESLNLAQSLSVQIARLTRRHALIGEIEPLAEMLARVLSLLDKLAEGKPGPQSQHHCLGKLARRLDKTYRMYSRVSGLEDWYAVWDEIRAGTELVICNEVNKRDNWVALVLSALEISYPSLDNRRDDFRALFRR